MMEKQNADLLSMLTTVNKTMVDNHSGVETAMSHMWLILCGGSQLYTQ